ncbi:unnamed protein product [Prorocentrum cordatum]|uniref:RNA-directed RNA polymerase n=1 Tax=Prorocentrum cordatum TaxID=2364126 RepID=A0ABN9PTL8_9DINO|nr:unnamed protein product [Polarella glacialis]CAK0869015.1 unnamed protein product [Polarella glacialis]
MAPTKGGKKAKAKAKSETPPQDGEADDIAPPPVKVQKTVCAGAALVVDGQVTGMNTDHFERLDAARDDVLNHASFKGIKTAAPLGIGKGGTKSPFNLDDFKIAIKDEGVYECGGNWWWINQNYQPVRNVYINEKMVEKDIAEKFAKPVSHVEREILVGVSRDTRNATVPVAGTLERLSPSEFDDAFLLAVHASVNADDKAALKIWNTAFLTVKFRFVAIDNEDDKMYKSIKERNRVSHNAEVASRTMLQRLLEFVYVLQRSTSNHGPLDAKDMAKLWNDNIGGTSGPSGEPISETYAKTAVAVYKAMILDTDVRQALIHSEKHFNKKSPFDSIYKLEAIMSKCKNNGAVMSFVINHITDTVLNGLTSPGEYAHRTMVGKGNNNKGTIDVFMLKYHALIHLTLGFPGEYSIDDTFVIETLKKIGNHQGYRQMSGYTADRKELSWWAKMTKSGRKLYELIEDLVYKTTFDGVIKQVLRNAGGNSQSMVAEVLNTCPVKDAVSEFIAELSAEKPEVQPPVIDLDGAGTDERGRASKTCAAITGEISIKEVAGQHIEAEMEDKLTPWLEFAQKLVSQWVDLHVEPDTGPQIGDILKKTNLPDMKGTPKVDNVLAYYDVKQAGTSNVSPHIRHPNFRAEHLRKCVVGFQDGRGSPDELVEGDMFMILDAQSHGNHGAFATALNKTSEPKPMVKEKRVYYLSYDEQSLKNRKSTVRETKVDQVEQAVVFTASTLHLAYKKRKFFNSSNQGNSIFPIAMPNYENTWRVPPKVRKQLFGKRGVILAGGAASSSYDPPTFKDGMEPSVVHFTALEETFALVCIRNKISYVGLVNSDEHKLLFRNRLIQRVYQDLSTEGSSNYQATCASLMKEVAGTMPKPAAADATVKDKGKDDTSVAVAKRGKSKAAVSATSGVPAGDNPLTSKRLEILAKLQGLSQANGVAGNAETASADAVQEEKIDID